MQGTGGGISAVLDADTEQRDAGRVGEGARELPVGCYLCVCCGTSVFYIQVVSCKV